jgi:hypothetical protein
MTRWPRSTRIARVIPSMRTKLLAFATGDLESVARIVIFAAVAKRAYANSGAAQNTAFPCNQFWGTHY